MNKGAKFEELIEELIFDKLNVCFYRLLINEDIEFSAK